MSYSAAFQQLTNHLDAAIATLAQQTRAFVLQHLPQVQETIDVPAKLAAYQYGTGYKNTVCVILVSKAGVKLGFYQGAQLPDPDHLLTGNGKVHRHVVIHSPDTLQLPALTLLIQQAMAAYQQRSFNQKS
jgi:hypothetical protein